MRGTALNASLNRFQGYFSGRGTILGLNYQSKLACQVFSLSSTLLRLQAPTKLSFRSSAIYSTKRRSYFGSNSIQISVRHNGDTNRGAPITS